MTISVAESVRAIRVTVSDEALIVDLADGRTITVPIGWYPRLAHATPAERQNFRLIGNNEGIHWLALDEDVSVNNLLSGSPSGESNKSFANWLANRNARGE